MNEQPSEWIGEQVQSVSKWLSENTRDVEWKGWDGWKRKKKETKEKDLAYYVTDHLYLEWDSMDKEWNICIMNCQELFYSGLMMNRSVRCLCKLKNG